MHRSRMGIAMASPSKQKYKTVQAEPGITRRVTRSQSREVEERGLYGETRQGKGKKGRDDDGDGELVYFFNFIYPSR